MDRLSDMLDALPPHDVPDHALEAVLAAVAREADAGLPPGASQREVDGRLVRAREIDAPRSGAGLLAVRVPHARAALAAAAALAAGLLVAAGLGLFSAPAQEPVGPLQPLLAVKGPPTVPAGASVHLGLSLLRASVPVALGADGVAWASDTLLLRYSTDLDGFAYVLRVDPSGALEVLHGTAATAGTHHVAVDGRIVGYPLAELRGRQRFAVAWSREPWAASDGTGQAAAAPGGLAAALHDDGPFPRALRGPLAGIVVDARDLAVDGAR